MRQRVLAFGTFDVLHPGHVALLRQASALGDVIISLTTDALCKTYKGRNPINSFAVRANRLRMLRSVNDIVASDSVPNSFDVIRRHRPSAIVLGYDQRALARPIKAKIEALGLATRLVIAEPYRGNLYHSTILRKFSGS